MVSIHGRQFIQPNYKNSSLYTAKNVAKPIEVNWVGKTILAHRENFFIDFQSCVDSRLDDLFWVYKLRIAFGNMLRMYVVPTQNFIDLPESDDCNAICHSPGYMNLRDAFLIQVSIFKEGF